MNLLGGIIKNHQRHTVPSVLHIVCMVLCSVSVSRLHATGIEQAYQDSVAAARGNAFGASVNNAAALHYNIAGLAWVNSTELRGSLLYVDGLTKFRSDDYIEKTINNEIITGSLFAAFPLGGDSGVWGFGLTAPYGLSIEYPEDSPLRSLAQHGELLHRVFTLGYARKFSHNLSIGAGLQYANDQLSTRQGLLTSGDYIAYHAAGEGFGFSLGLQWKPSVHHSFGLSYRSTIDVNFTGDLTQKTIIPIEGKITTEGTSSLEFPDQITISYACQTTDRLLMEISGQWTNWDTFDQFTIKTQNSSLTTPWHYDPSWIFGVGITYSCSPSLDFHAGYLYGMKSITDETFSPFVPDANLHVISMGAEYHADTWSLSLTFLHGLRESRDVAGSPANPYTSATSDGVWDTSGNTALFGFSKKF